MKWAFSFEMFGKHTTASLQDLAGFHGTARSVATGSNRSDVSSISHHAASEHFVAHSFAIEQ